MMGIMGWMPSQEHSEPDGNLDTSVTVEDITPNWPWSTVVLAAAIGLLVIKVIAR